MKLARITAVIMALALLATGGCAQAADDKPLSKQGFLLNTTVTIAIYGSTDQSILDGAFELCGEYEQLFSRTIEGSDVDRMNRAGGEPVEVSDATAELTAIALNYARLSDGAFDPTIEPLSSLWNFTSDTPSVPDAADIAAALARVDWTRVTLAGNTVTLGADMGIDLGGIAKGYIADRLRDYLEQRGVTGAIINLGGNVLTLGHKPSGKPFTVGIQKPFGERSTDLIGAYRVDGMSVVTSGVYERYFVQDGVRYHHILDTATGYPIMNDIYSVTILSPNSIEGDALSTTCFALGVDKGLELINSLDGIEAVYCLADGTLVFSDGARERWVDPDDI